MNNTEQRIIDYLNTTKEANVYEIQANIDYWELDPINKLKGMLSVLTKRGLIKKYTNAKYRIAKEQQDDKQINLF